MTFTPCPRDLNCESVQSILDLQHRPTERFSVSDTRKDLTPWVIFLPSYTDPRNPCSGMFIVRSPSPVQDRSPGVVPTHHTGESGPNLLRLRTSNVLVLFLNPGGHNSNSSDRRTRHKGRGNDTVSDGGGYVCVTRLQVFLPLHYGFSVFMSDSPHCSWSSARGHINRQTSETPVTDLRHRTEPPVLADRQRSPRWTPSPYSGLRLTEGY